MHTPSTRVTDDTSTEPDVTRLQTPAAQPGTSASDEPDVTRLQAPGAQLGASPSDEPDVTRLHTPASVAGKIPDAGPLTVGQAFGPRYHIIRELGVGGMGAVYQAWDQELAVTVALKVIRPEVMADPGAAADLKKRFKRELLLAREVTHKNVVRIHDLGEIDGIKYITMAYVDGEDLASVLKREGKLPVPRVIRIARSVVSGLVAAHAAGIVHRDLKPANIMVGSDDEAMIMDFGIARSTGPMARSAPGGQSMPQAQPQAPSPWGAVRPEATVAASIVGTIEYMAPEQARALPVDQRADVYSFGLILYDLLTGRLRAQRAESAISELQSRMEKAPPPVRSLSADFPEALDRLVSRCLEPDPEKRFQTTAELEAELSRLDDEGVPIPVKRVFGVRVVTAMIVLFLALLGTTWYFARGPGAVSEQKAVSVLIADFDNRANDPVFDRALEQALGIAIEGASFVTTFPRDEAQKIATKVGAGKRLDEKAALLVSSREGINVVLAGAIEPKDSGYAVSVKVIDPGNGRTLDSASATAATKGDVLRAVGSVASRIRGALGDATPESEKLAAAETVSTASLEALADYSHGQDLLFNLKNEEALVYYRRAIDRDPNFGRAYASSAMAALNLGRRDDAEVLWKKALPLMDRMTEREKYRTLGGYYLSMTQNYDKAIENFKYLIERYPYDRVGHLSLALAYFFVRDFAKALEEGRRSIEVDPTGLIARSNYSLYAMYAGDFKTASAEAKRILERDPNYFRTYMPFAVAAIMSSDPAGAADAYARMAAADGAQGSSIANIGLADLAMYQGRSGDAVGLLRAGLAADEKKKDTAYRATKHLMLAEAYEADGNARLALQEVRAALQPGSRDEAVLVPAARLLVRVGKVAEAEAIVSPLNQSLEAHSRAYGSMIAGEIAAQRKRTVDAVGEFRSSVKLTDLWLARFDLGVTYVQAGYHAEALSELELCMKRRGEASAVFLDDVPSVRYLATLPYWLGRAQEGVGLVPAAAESYKSYVQNRAAAARDPLLTDARRRLKTIQGN